MGRTVIPSQKPIWDKKHGAGDHEELRYIPSPLAELAEPKFPRNSKILELGCGVGRDAVFFEQKGHRVLATDVSDVVIEQNKEKFPDSKVEFEVLDIQEPLPYSPASFDVVYSNLALHYYSDKKTKEIIREISKVLRFGGVFAFACKSYDALRESGTEVEKNIFVSPLGVTVHLFSEDYAKSLLTDLFDIEHLDEVSEVYHGRDSKNVRCVARKLNE